MISYGGNRPTVNDNEVLTAQDFNDATRFWVTDELPDTGKDGDVVFVIGDSPVGDSGELPGLGGWSTIESVSGTYTKSNTWTDADGNEWVTYTFTDDGTITTSGGLIDVHVIGAGGGGGGTNVGNSDDQPCGGGGGGSYVHSLLETTQGKSNQVFIPGMTNNAGSGNPRGTRGGNTSVGTVVAYGGGGGGGNYSAYPPDHGGGISGDGTQSGTPSKDMLAQQPNKSTSRAGAGQGATAQEGFVLNLNGTEELYCYGGMAANHDRNASTAGGWNHDAKPNTGSGGGPGNTGGSSHYTNKWDGTNRTGQSFGGQGGSGIAFVRVPPAYATATRENPHAWISYATVENGVVTKVTKTPDNKPYTASAQEVECDASVQEGYLYENGEFTAPEPDYSEEIEALTARLEELRNG